MLIAIHQRLFKRVQVNPIYEPSKEENWQTDVT
ncbi:hypothetical protein J2Z26_003885 [Bacillus luteolus]|nr:hypothetical protein [Cytobacillus luteolus]